jgi:hypothetical protein
VCRSPVPGFSGSLLTPRSRSPSSWFLGVTATPRADMGSTAIIRRVLLILSRPIHLTHSAHLIVFRLGLPYLGLLAASG